jgi:hypothetical protein
MPGSETNKLEEPLAGRAAPDEGDELRLTVEQF